MSPFSPAALDLAGAILVGCRRRGWRLATAESCTGGLVAGALTEIPGSSDVFDRGFVTYSNVAKQSLLGVDPELIRACGAVSGPVALAMATGALAASNADLSLAVTGIAGPGGGSSEKPVGTVHFATAVAGGVTMSHVEHYGDLGRSEVRLAAIRTALDLLQTRLE